MTNIAVIENKISALRQYLKILDGYKKYTLKDIEKDVTLTGAVEHYLYLAVQATIDLAEAVISIKNLRKPSTYRESFDILREEGVLDTQLANMLITMASFRNVIAHDYQKVDLAIVYDTLHKRLTDIELFIAQVKQHLQL